MVKYIISLITAVIYLACSTTTIHAKPLTFTAIYDVYEDDTIKAVTTSRLQKLDHHHYQLTDITEGTKGLTSLLNFKRTEHSKFIYRDQKAEMINHNMKQKVAFKSKLYKFSHQPGEFSYQGINRKKPFKLNSQQPLLSTHVMSWQLAQQVCHNPKDNMQWQILKSDEPKTYFFKTVAVDNDKILVHRIYQNRSDKSTRIWINSRDCYIEQIIYEDNGKIVRTVIKDINFN